MLEIEIPVRGTYQLQHLVLDVNVPLAGDGVVLPGVAERLAILRATFTLHLLTADTHGRQAAIDALLGLTAVRLRQGEPEAAPKAAFVRALGTADASTPGQRYPGVNR